jgi:ArsR family transcriptional regulator, zinc-responsive transcriptional repressor
LENDRVSRIASGLELLPAEVLKRSAECLKVMAHPVRLRMVEILSQGEFVVNDIAEICEIPPSQACEHLRLMKGHGFLDSERRGREVYYYIVSPNLPGLLECIRRNCGENCERADS